MERYDEQQAADAAWAFLRSNTTANIKFGEHMSDVLYIIGSEGRLVIPAMVAMLQICDMNMFVPEYSDNCMEIHISLCQISEDGEGGKLADRWRVYHGEPDDVQWAIIEIDAARFHEKFIDGDGLCRENPLSPFEPSICKEINTNLRTELRRVCKAGTNVEVTNPIVVGVDPLGLDVRAPFGIIRVPSTTPLLSSDDVYLMLST